MFGELPQMNLGMYHMWEILFQVIPCGVPPLSPQFIELWGSWILPLFRVERIGQVERQQGGEFL